jgi:hypothetical protein
MLAFLADRVFATGPRRGPCLLSIPLKFLLAERLLAAQPAARIDFRLAEHVFATGRCAAAVAEAHDGRRRRRRLIALLVTER